MIFEEPFLLSPSGGTQLLGLRKQKVKGRCCSYKEMWKIQKLIGVQKGADAASDSA